MIRTVGGALLSLGFRRSPELERIHEISDSLATLDNLEHGEIRSSIVEAIVLIEAGHPKAADERLRYALGHGQ